MSFLRKNSDSHTLSTVIPMYLSRSVPFRRKSRQSSTDSSDSTTSNVTTGSVGSSVSTSTASSSSNPFLGCAAPTTASALTDVEIVPPSDKLLHGHRSHIQCAKCSTDLCLTSQIISKGFTGRHGRAYLVQGTTSHLRTTISTLPNTFLNRPIPRNLVTGQHIVSDLSCAICGSNLGWKYVQASEEGQKYKVGKFILETKKIRVNVSWENEDESENDDDNNNNNNNQQEALRLQPALTGPGKYKDQQHIDDLPLEFDSQDEDECEDLFAGVWAPKLAAERRARKQERLFGKRPVAALMNLGATDSLDILS